ncbi:hypothetical protein BU25DRAFT_424161 [Macroventuria anomochaeta]|uniref:Uncharacterized protein n=1 Tax=Macroventuria anomochaeta TaxID=301207 RepID=A0ACB6RU59_9PLEO|nr:uncharacterized protein BU25DRAFT_424161 [Macroventuria anomochaeta]KAF2624382.1 hypothetical protein BU25DRAFT_424161 [Macroventuria anomochaeta]
MARAPSCGMVLLASFLHRLLQSQLQFNPQSHAQEAAYLNKLVTVLSNNSAWRIPPTLFISATLYFYASIPFGLVKVGKSMRLHIAHGLERFRGLLEELGLDDFLNLSEVMKGAKPIGVFRSTPNQGVFGKLFVDVDPSADSPLWDEELGVKE